MRPPKAERGRCNHAAAALRPRNGRRRSVRSVRGHRLAASGSNAGRPRERPSLRRRRSLPSVRGPVQRAFSDHSVCGSARTRIASLRGPLRHGRWRSRTLPAQPGRGIGRRRSAVREVLSARWWTTRGALRQPRAKPLSPPGIATRPRPIRRAATARYRLAHLRLARVRANAAGSSGTQRPAAAIGVPRGSSPTDRWTPLPRRRSLCVDRSERAPTARSDPWRRSGEDTAHPAVGAAPAGSGPAPANPWTPRHS